MTPASVLLSNVYGALDEMDIVEGYHYEVEAGDVTVIPGGCDDGAAGTRTTAVGQDDSGQKQNLHKFQSIRRLIAKGKQP